MNLNAVLEYLLAMATALSVTVDGRTHTIKRGRLGVHTTIPQAPFVDISCTGFDTGRSVIDSSSHATNADIGVSFFATAGGTDVTTQELVTNAFAEAMHTAVKADRALNNLVIYASVTRMRKRMIKLNNKDYLLAELTINAEMRD